MQNPRTRAILLFLLALTFGVLIFGGYLINREKPPIPDRVVAENGDVLFTGKDVMAGQQFYFSRGGQHIGTIWGHGSYLAPDWSADYLHRLGLYLAARHHGLDDGAARRFTQPEFDDLPATERARLTGRVAEEIKTNRYNPAEDVLTLTPHQADAFKVLQDYYTQLFVNGHERMGLQSEIVKTPDEGFRLTSFFAWLAWAAGTQRPDADHTYTANWPYDPLVGNHPVPDALIWSIVSVVLLIFGIAAALFYYLRYIREDDYETQLVTEFGEPDPTPSQKATLAYFLTAVLLFVIQIAMGAATGHYTVEGTHFFGIPIGHLLPYAVVRTWHLQLAVFFIATCFLAAGLFIGPFVGHEPRRQGFWVLFLFAAVVIVVVGSMSGAWLSITGRMDGFSFYFGHQGYEFIELGRVWQVLLIVGMLIWLVLMFRSIAPALKTEDDKGGLTHMLLYSSAAIPLFYMAGLMYGRESHLSDAEYWRWWVVHLWVEGFFEVFATVVMAFLLSRIGAVSKKFALVTVNFIVFLYLGSGVIGTFHHLYWSGSPMPILALGAVFSALEVVPLTMLGFEVVHNLKVVREGGEAYAYKWPVYFFISVAFWNLVGAGVFGFLLNPPIVLYYIQGINTTPIHSHTALFGVYGLLAISLMLFSVRHIVSRAAWSDRLLKWSFWGLNGGLAAMAVFHLIPAGFYQMWFAVKHGLWYARSPEIATGSVIRALTWVSTGPHLVFAAGAVLLLIFMLRAIRISFVTKNGNTI